MCVFTCVYACVHVHVHVCCTHMLCMCVCIKQNLPSIQKILKKDTQKVTITPQRKYIPKLKNQITFSDPNTRESENIYNENHKTKWTLQPRSLKTLKELVCQRESQEIKILEYRDNKNKNTMSQNFWDAQAMLRGKFIALNIDINKQNMN